MLTPWRKPDPDVHSIPAEANSDPRFATFKLDINRPRCDSADDASWGEAAGSPPSAAGDSGRSPAPVKLTRPASGTPEAPGAPRDAWILLNHRCCVVAATAPPRRHHSATSAATISGGEPTWSAQDALKGHRSTRSPWWRSSIRDGVSASCQRAWPNRSSRFAGRAGPNPRVRGR